MRVVTKREDGYINMTKRMVMVALLHLHAMDCKTNDHDPFEDPDSCPWYSRLFDEAYEMQELNRL